MGFLYRVLRFTLPRTNLYRLSWKKCQAHRHLRPYHEPFDNLADGRNGARWCSSRNQRRKHDISTTSLHMLATHNIQVGLRPHTKLGRATFLGKLPSWRTLDLEK